MEFPVKVSIIIPCFNCAELVVQSLEGLEKQSYKDFEVICVNDGSTDNTFDVISSYSKNSTMRIRILSQDNAGVSRTRNRALREAHGEYVLFLDSDDVYHNYFIEALIEAIEKTKSDISYCRLSRDFDEVINNKSLNRGYVLQTQNEAMHNLLYRMGDFGFYCYLYKTDVLNRINLRFNENTRFFEDREFNWKYLSHCKNAAFVDTPMYYYRLNPNSATQSKNVEWKDEDIRAVLRVEDYLEKEKCEYASEVKNFLLARVLWGKALRYSRAGRKDLMKRLSNDFDMKLRMKQTLKDKNWLVRFSSILYLISPAIFYWAVRLKK